MMFGGCDLPLSIFAVLMVHRRFTAIGLIIVIRMLLNLVTFTAYSKS